MNRYAVYAGTFDPPTVGHVDIVKRICPLFDKIFIVVAHNVRKKTLFSASERVELLRTSLKSQVDLKNIEIHEHSGLVVDFCKEHHIHVLIRGLRAISDFENEFQISAMNRRLAPEIETLHVMTDEKYNFLSSTLIKEVAFHGGALDHLVAKEIIPQILARIQNV